MYLELKRIRVRHDTTDGLLRFHNRLVCNTAEYTPHCLESGSYEVKIETGTDGARKIMIRKENGRKSCGELIAGNGVYTTNPGTIIVGDAVTWGVCINSEKRWKELLEMFSQYVLGKEIIHLDIV
jgi:hypothetical protein